MTLKLRIPRPRLHHWNAVARTFLGTARFGLLIVLYAFCRLLAGVKPIEGDWVFLARLGVASVLLLYVGLVIRVGVEEQRAERARLMARLRY